LILNVIKQTVLFKASFELRQLRFLESKAGFGYFKITFEI